MAENIDFILTLKNLLSPGLKDAQQQSDKLTESFRGLKTHIAAAFGAYQAFHLIKDITETTAKFEALNNVINFTAKDTKEASENHAFLQDIIHKYKLPIEETTEGFSQLSAVLMGTRLAGQGARDVFEGVSVAATAMHLSAQTTQSVFFALNQMISKGKVQAQEMTLQLGNALPGALKLASAAMHMTTAQFTDAMQKGAINAQDFVVKFAHELKSTFQGAIPNAIQSLQARMNEFNNTLVETKLELGERLKPAIENILQLTTEWIKQIVPLTDFLFEHSDIIKTIAVALTAMAGTYAIVTMAQKIQIWYTGLSTAAIILNTLATEGLQAALMALNIAIESNPIGILIVAVGLLAGAWYAASGAVDDYYDATENRDKKKRQAVDDARRAVESMTETIYKTTPNVTLEQAKEQAKTSEIESLKAALQESEKQKKIVSEALLKTPNDLGLGLKMNILTENVVKYSNMLEAIGYVPDKSNKKTGPGPGSELGLTDSSTLTAGSKVSGTKQVIINVNIKEMMGIKEARFSNVKDSAEAAGSSLLKSILGTTNQYAASENI